MTAGPLLFARYAYPPNALGLCGADETRTLLEYGAAGESDGGLAGARAHLRGGMALPDADRATANRIDDPLDPRVVEAYWVGNGLLDRSRPARSRGTSRTGSAAGSGRAGDVCVDAVAAGAVPHHNFHVLAVYPWLGLLRTGIVDQPLHVLDQCRTTPALVGSVNGDSAPCACARSSGTAARSSSGRATSRDVRWRDEGCRARRGT